jgi:putative ABC transport system substrate-binding protein
MLEMLSMAFPNVRNIGLLADQYFFRRPVVQDLLSQSFDRFGTHVHPFVAETGEELERVFSMPSVARIDAWIVPETPVVFRHEERVVSLVNRTRVPNVFGHPSMLDKGAIMTFGVDFPDMWEEVARVLAMICSGIPAQEIPIVRPHRLFLGLSVTNAARQGLQFSPKIYRLSTFTH